MKQTVYKLTHKMISFNISPDTATVPTDDTDTPKWVIATIITVCLFVLTFVVIIVAFLLLYTVLKRRAVHVV